MSWLTFLAVGVGGGLGAMLRYAASLFIEPRLGTNFPWATFIVNISGGLIMGILIGLMSSRWQAPTEMRLLLTTGFLGGLTTFSTFSLEAVQLLQQRQIALGLLYIGGSVFLAIMAVIVGVFLIRGLEGFS